MAPSVLYIADRSDWSRVGADYVRKIFPRAEVIHWGYGETVPCERLAAWEGDWLISVKNDLVIPAGVLAKARQGAVNFHPAPPEYRGLGGYNYALYNDDASYGVTVHRMIAELDKGTIAWVLRFPILPWDTMSSLRDRTSAYCLVLLCELVSYIENGRPLPISDEKWGARLYTRKTLDAFLTKLRATEVGHRCLQ